MSKFTFQKAVRQQTKVRIALTGPSGAGKTQTSMTLATELAEGGRIAVIDTERGSASLYADEFDFDVLEFPPPYDPRLLVTAMQEAEAAGYAVIIIDSSTHFYKGEGGTLDIADAAGKRASGNTYVGWKEATPIQDAFYAAVRNSGCHVIATMRSKTEYVLEVGKNGKSAPVKRGMAAEQRQGAEYEFDFVLDMTHEHDLVVSKTRATQLDELVFGAGDAAACGKMLTVWSQAGAEPASEEQLASIKALVVALGLTPEQNVKGLVHYVGASAMDKLNPEKAGEYIAILEGKVADRDAKAAAAVAAAAPAEDTLAAELKDAVATDDVYDVEFDGEAAA